MADPIILGASSIDLGPRLAQSSAITGSPSTNAITAVCTLTFPNFGRLQVVTGVQLEGMVCFTVGTSGVSAKLDIRQTGTAGAVLVTTGALTVTAANLVTMSIQAIDTAPLAAGVWVLALTIGSGAATSTVSATQLFATAY